MRSLNYLRTIALFMIVLMLSLPIALASELNLVYDSNGNLVTGDSFYREYNELNQLVTVREGNTSSGTILQEYLHHPTEERILVKRTYENGVLNQKIIYVNDNFVQVINSSGTWNETYVYQDGVLIAQNIHGRKQSIHADNIGSSNLVIDENGNIIENSYTSPYGEPIKGGEESRFSYTGKEFDNQVNQYDFEKRMYRAEWGRFLQPDSLLPNFYDPQQLNRYAYARNNPYRNIDRTGGYSEDVVEQGIKATVIGIAIIVVGAPIAAALAPAAVAAATFYGVAAIGTSVAIVGVGQTAVGVTASPEQAQSINDAFHYGGNNFPGVPFGMVDYASDTQIFAIESDLASYERTTDPASVETTAPDGTDLCQMMSSEVCNNRNNEDGVDPTNSLTAEDITGKQEEEEKKEEKPAGNGGGGRSGGCRAIGNAKCPDKDDDEDEEEET